MAPLWRTGIALTLALVSTTSDAQQVDHRQLDSTIARARSLIADGMRENQIPGLLVAVAVHSEMLWSEAFGMADIESRTPMTPATRTRIGSISKSLTAAALMRLRESGKIDLDAEVQTYVPVFPRKSFPISVRQLAGHLSGIRHYAGNEFVSRVAYQSVGSALTVFATDTLLFQPGTRFGYSTYGYSLLSAAIEGAARQPFIAYLRASVTEPLELGHTMPDHADSLVPQRAVFYDRLPNGWQRAVTVDNSNKWAGGGYLSTAADLVRFGSRLLRPGFVTQESLDLMFATQRLVDGTPTGYGIGWYSSTDSAGHLVASHGGTSIGATGALSLHLKDEVVVAVLVNTTASRFVNRATEEIAHLFLMLSRR